MSKRVQVSEDLFQILPLEEQRAVLRLGVAFRQVGWQERLRRAEAPIREMEARYGCPLAELEEVLDYIPAHPYTSYRRFENHPEPSAFL